MTLALPARAKLNLDLSVRARRPDGYHDITTTLQAISLHDLLAAQAAADTSLDVDGLPVSSGADNLVLKAHAAVEAAAGRRLPTRFRLTKRIPPGAGLGGGSSDAATTLRLLKRLHALDVQLEPLARQLGADVAFFLTGGRATATGRGDELTPLPHEERWFAVAWPGFELSTAAVYAAWDDRQGTLDYPAAAVEPRLEEFRRRLGDGWHMTGTGSAFFQVFDDQESAQAALDDLDCWTTLSTAVPRWD